MKKSIGFSKKIVSTACVVLVAAATPVQAIDFSPGKWMNPFNWFDGDDDDYYGPPPGYGYGGAPGGYIAPPPAGYGYGGQVPMTGYGQQVPPPGYGQHGAPAYMPPQMPQGHLPQGQMQPGFMPQQMPPMQQPMAPGYQQAIPQQAPAYSAGGYPQQQQMPSVQQQPFNVPAGGYLGEYYPNTGGM